jgi:5'-nucleotidase
MEGSIEGIPSAGFSLCDFSHDADFTLASKIARSVASNILQHGLPVGNLLNVNIPKLEESAFKGVKVCRQAHAKWEEDFDERQDPNGKKYYWLTGKFVNYDKGDDTDEWALANGYASIVPVQYDLTAHNSIGFINQWSIAYED